MISRITPGLLLVFFTACDGVIGLPKGMPGHTDDPHIYIDAGPTPCEPQPAAVPKLLRLSNFEYRNIVSDVLGVPVDEALFARWTPVAQVYGFDTMSETRIDQQGLLEQLDTAEGLANIVMQTRALTAHCPAIRPVQTPACTSKLAYSALDDFADTQGRECWSYVDSAGAVMAFDNTTDRWRTMPDQGNYLWRNGAHPGGTVDAVRRWLAPVDGTLNVTGSFTDVDPGGGDGVLVTVRKGANVLFTRDIPNGGPAAPFTFQVAVTQNEQLEFIVNRKGAPAYDTTAFTANLAFKPTPRKAAWTWASCVEPLVTRLASRSFRRPVRAEELADYKAVFESNVAAADMAAMAEPVDHALTATLVALFLSPNVVFKPELVPEGLGEKEKQFGIASRISLFTRSSIADDKLWDLAETGKLDTPAAIRAELERMLDANVARFSTHFGGQWLDYRESPPLGPLTAPLLAESNAVFSAVLTENLTPEKLMNPGFTIVSPELATHYGLTGVGMGSRITTTERGGLLSQGRFLISTATGSEFRRPIHRGLWTLTRLLCRTLPRLDPATLQEISGSLDMIDRNLPLPEQMALHRNSQTRCGACHSQMDPVGLALEKYDPQGKWRDTYANGAPIETDLEFNGKIVRDPHELSKEIELSTEFRACVGEKLFTFALNRGPQDTERCVSQRIGNPLDGSKPTFRAMTLDAMTKAMELAP
ncbi:MAG: DUF1588 domain-containing protein [Myxococcaceae bacterium]|nr:DUF1588 domain-containing protein [Myxococcaceae bacterium]